MQNPPYYPTRITDLLPWAGNFATLLTANPATYGLTVGDASACQAAYDAWEPVQAQALEPATRTSAIVAQAAQLRADMAAVLQPRATLISQNASVTAEDKTAIGVTLRSSVRTPVTAPTVAPLLSLEAVRTNAVAIRYANAETPNSKAAPRGCGGVEIVGVYGTAPATDPTEGAILGRITKSPGQINTAGHQGQTLTIWCRWVTKNGIAGGQVGYSPFSIPLVVVCN